MLPEVTASSTDRKRPWPDVMEVIACACATGARALVVVQNASLGMIDMATGCDVIRRKGVRMRNRKLREIRPSEAI